MAMPHWILKAFKDGITTFSPGSRCSAWPPSWRSIFPYVLSLAPICDSHLLHFHCTPEKSLPLLHDQPLVIRQDKTERRSLFSLLRIGKVGLIKRWTIDSGLVLRMSWLSDSLQHQPPWHHWQVIRGTWLQSVQLSEEQLLCVPRGGRFLTATIWTLWSRTFPCGEHLPWRSCLKTHVFLWHLNNNLKKKTRWMQ